MQEGSPVPTNYTKTDSFQAEMPNAIGTIQYPNMKYTPEEIFSGKIDLLSIDFISGKTPSKDANGVIQKDADGNIIYTDNTNSGWMNVRKVISQWYKVLRMVAIIGLLSVLIYTGIKIMISANAKDKAKYKEWIINWFIAVAILFSMHYIMSFIISVINEINVLLGQACQGISVTPAAGSDFTPFTTNLMGLVRFMIQAEDFGIKVAYEVMYIALIVYTIKFTIVYLKRVLNMAFLTLIAPIVALTYPIDKLNDGQAQGFNMWLKEYIYNALLQPMHFIMYYVLVGSAVSVAAHNPIYGIVVLAFMTEAERLLKKIFGFDKAGGGTVGGMAGAFAAGAIASSVKDIARMAKLPTGNAGKGSAGGGSSNILDNLKPSEDPNKLTAFSNGSDSGDNRHNNQENKTEQNTTENNDKENNSEQNTTENNDKENNSEQNTIENNEEEDKLDQNTIENNEEEDKKEDKEEDKEKEQNTSGIREKVKDSKVYKGSKAVGKRLLKPVWDFDHKGKRGLKYNGKRLAKKVGRVALGATLGTAAAAVQAGISITDGKYNPMEGVATFTAGYAGGGQIAKGVGSAWGSLKDTYTEGTLPEDSEKRKREIVERAKQKYPDRDDVIKFNKQNYAGKEEDMMKRQKDNYIEYGYSNPKDMKNAINYANKYIKGQYTEDEWKRLSDNEKKVATKKADIRAIQAENFRKRLESQKQEEAIYDKDKRDKYIEEMARQEAARIKREKGRDATQQEIESTKATLREAFKAVVEYDDANR